MNESYNSHIGNKILKMQSFKIPFLGYFIQNQQQKYDPNNRSALLIKSFYRNPR